VIRGPQASHDFLERQNCSLPRLPILLFCLECFRCYVIIIDCLLILFDILYFSTDGCVNKLLTYLLTMLCRWCTSDDVTNFSTNFTFVEVCEFCELHDICKSMVHTLSTQSLQIWPLTNELVGFLDHWFTYIMGPCGALGHCRISPPRFLTEGRKRRLSQGSFVSAVCLVVCFLWFVFCLCVYFCDL